MKLQIINAMLAAAIVCIHLLMHAPLRRRARDAIAIPVIDYRNFTMFGIAHIIFIGWSLLPQAAGVVAAAGRVALTIFLTLVLVRALRVWQLLRTHARTLEIAQGMSRSVFRPI